ncbi:MAG: hypothetical protein K2Y05_06030, partial [Hyphomicrobiaceae bacterium]|nr:hypothetical protein [Hyphomicrobiaceae bacterium]
MTVERGGLPWLMGSAAWVAAAAAIVTHGFDGLSLVLGIAGALLLAIVVPGRGVSVRASQSGLSADADMTVSRFLQTATGLGLGLAAVLLVAAELQVAATGIDLSLPGTGAAVGVAVVSALAVAAFQATAGGRALRAVRLVSVAVVLGLVAVATAVLVVRDGPGALLSLPAVGEITAIEARLRDARLADPATLRAHTVPFLRTDMVNFASLSVLIAAGFAVLLAADNDRSAGRPEHDANRVSHQGLRMILLLSLAVTCLLPALAVGAKRDMMAAFAAGIKVAGPPAWLTEQVAAGTIEVCGKVAVSSATTVADLCGKGFGRDGLLRWQDVVFLRDGAFYGAARTTGMPQMAGLVFVVIAIAGAAGTALAVGVLARRSETGPGDVGVGGLGGRGSVLLVTAGVLALGGGVAASGFFETGALVALAASVLGIVLVPNVVASRLFRAPSAMAAVVAMAVGIVIVLGLGLMSKVS